MIGTENPVMMVRLHPSCMGSSLIGKTLKNQQKCLDCFKNKNTYRYKLDTYSNFNLLD